MYDAAIIGTGPAGISAALTLKALNKSLVLFGPGQLSGKIRAAEKIRNYPGLSMVSGTQMQESFRIQLEEMGISITEKTVTGIFNMGTHYGLLCNQEVFEARTVLLCTGVEAVKPCTAAFTRRFVRNDATIASAVSRSSCGDCPASAQRLKPTPLDPLRPLMAGGCVKRNSAA